MPGNVFEVEQRRVGDRGVVVVRGEVDMATAPRITAAVADAVADNPVEVVLDFRAVSFMDSSGIHLLLNLAEAREAGVAYSMVDGTPPVRGLLELAGCSEVLPRADPALLDS